VIENYPWAGHLGIKLIEKVIPIILKGTTTLIFTNTRAQAEIWYQQLLETAPELSGLIAMHHGSIAQETREWVEDMLHTEKLKAVVCTSSLDLGVDFRPVGQIIQIGGPKGVARFIQRAGRSGHQPGMPSIIYFVPTHALELVEAAALRTAINEGIVEGKEPLIRSFDVLIQYLVTRAVGGGFDPKQVYAEIKSTYSYATISSEEYQWAIDFITTGGESLGAYDEFKKVEWITGGRLMVKDRRMAMRHRLSIGTIVSDPSMRVSFLSGKYLGTIEEWFIAKLKPGSTFWFAGRNLEFVHIKEMTAYVKKTDKKNGIVPSWQGGRMPFSSQMSELLRKKLEESHDTVQEKEMERLKPLLALQNQLSIVPRQNQFLIEQLETKDGHHLFFYPFEGRLVHEGLSALIAYRLSKRSPISFTFAMNDYGFELLSDQPIPIDENQIRELFGEEDLVTEIYASINATEMMRRRFREISVIAGLVFTGYPGQAVKNKHLQASGSLFYEVFQTYDPNNQLIKQAMEEVLLLKLEETRLRSVLQRIKSQEIIIKKLDRPSPFSFPIIVDWMREKLSSESLEDRIKKMKVNWKSNV
jgi:ATP-dependent Lhr-like helicase